ncbi:MAG: aspartate aminotransferase family protein [Chitinophagaceae bacterium]
MNNRQLFLQHVAQTSDAPIALEICKAEGIYLYDSSGKKYIDGISGFSVNNIGHGNPLVIKAIQEQSTAYMHTIVYGEFIQQPQVQFAHLLTQNLPSSLNCVYFTNSGTEAIEGAMKLAKRITKKSKIISCYNAYHGSTQGALSIMGGDYWQQNYRPLLPDIFRFNFGSDELIDAIDKNTCCVIIEPVQAEAGVVATTKEWFKKLREKCNQHCVVLIMDAIQTGFGRTGFLWGFEPLEVEPDILVIGKALGGGLPLGAFIADKKLMHTLAYNPVLGHITTFGGNPVCCAAGMAAFKFLLEANIIKDADSKGKFLKEKLSNQPLIQKINQVGLWLAIEFETEEICREIAHTCVTKGLVTDWFLFAPKSIRLAPPLIITQHQLETIVEIVVESIHEVAFS